MSDSESLSRFVISPETPISDAIVRLDLAGIGALAVCGQDGKLFGIFTDGDLRRAVLNSKALNAPCIEITTRNPIVVLRGTSRFQSLLLMNQHDVDHLPVVDELGILQEMLLRKKIEVDDDFEESPPDLFETTAISPTSSIADAIAQLDKAGTGALVLCASDKTLHGLLSDGDIRRAILRRISMDTACETIATKSPLTVSPAVSAADALQLMNEHDINHLPVVDEAGRVTKLLLRKNLARNARSPLFAVIMVGGYGKRLLPLTERTPKPMLPVGHRPLLELTIRQLRRSGIRDISLTTHYLAESIKDHFGDGRAFGIRLSYLKEDFPLGTAGGLRLLKRPEGPFVVINGDILTGVPFREMLDFHRKYRAQLTVGVRKYDVQVPFGVVECDEVHVTKIQEKPSLNFFINAGIYLLEPSAYDFIPEGVRFDMTELIQALLEAGKPIVSFPIMEYWLDIGQQQDYQKAQDDVLKGRF